MVRRAAIIALQNLPPEQKRGQLAPLLNDSIRTVRMEAASALVDSMLGATPEQLQAFNKAAASMTGRINMPKLKSNCKWS